MEQGICDAHIRPRRRQVGRRRPRRLPLPVPHPAGVHLETGARHPQVHGRLDRVLHRHRAYLSNRTTALAVGVPEAHDHKFNIPQRGGLSLCLRRRRRLLVCAVREGGVGFEEGDDGARLFGVEDDGRRLAEDHRVAERLPWKESQGGRKSDTGEKERHGEEWGGGEERHGGEWGGGEESHGGEERHKGEVYEHTLSG